MISPDAVTVALAGGFFADNHDYIIRLGLKRGSATKGADIRISYELLESDKIATEERTQLGLRLGLPRLRAMIETEGVDEFLGSSDHKVVKLTTDSVPNGLVARMRSEKSCIFMVRGKTGLICDVSRVGLSLTLDPHSATTLPVCLGCGHPDDTVRCSELMHVTTAAELLGAVGWHRDAQGICGIGNRVMPDGAIGGMTPELEKQRVSKCRVGERECARLYWQAAAAPAFAKADGRGLLREFDNLNLVVNERHGFKPVIYPHGETTARVANDARTSDEFASAVSALAALIGAMRWQGVEGPSIQAMETFARGHGVVLDPRAVRVLRHVARLRQAPPVHFVEAEAAAAATALGITYPPDDPRAAWSQLQSITTWSIATIGDSFREVAPDSNGTS